MLLDVVPILVFLVWFLWLPGLLGLLRLDRGLGLVRLGHAGFSRFRGSRALVAPRARGRR